MVVACTQNASPAPKSAPPPSPTKPPATATASSAKPTGPATPAPKATAAATTSSISFAGKTITVVVPFAPGGGADIMARLFATYLPRSLPGNPAMVVRNMPGGEATIGANFVYASKPDGLTILQSAGSVAMADMLDKPALKFSSLTEFTMVLALPISDIYYFKPSIFNKPEDIVNAKGIIYGHSSGATTTIFLSVNEMVGIPTDKVITAYNAGDARRAFIAGEINGSSDTNLGFAQFLRPFYEKGDAKILFQAGMLDESGNIVKLPGFPADVLTGKELYEKVHGKAPSGPAYDAYKSLLASVKTIGNPLYLPPGTSDAIKRAYWAAAEKMVKDPDFLRAADPAAGAGARWMAGEAFDRMSKKEFGLRPEVRAWLSDLLTTKYGIVLE